jgi:peptide/nickel transport system substrate-binding protein
MSGAPLSMPWLRSVGRRARHRRFIIALLALGLLATSCGDDASDGAPTADVVVSTTSTTRPPRVGGTLSFATYSEPIGLDPIVATGAGVTGSIEMSAVFDTMMRYNPDSGQYEPRTALSIESNSTFTEWTVKLRPGVKFSDGTDYDAAAVVFGWNRHRAGIPGAPPCAEVWACPRNTTASSVYMAMIKQLDVVDPLTVKATLTEPWRSFAWVLATESGMIPSPTALKQCDATKPISQCAFNLKPVGAGPFTVESFKPKDSINLVRNPTYWGGPAYLDGVRFLNYSDSGGEKTYDALKSGTINVAFLRNSATVATARSDGFMGITTLQMAGSGYLLNHGGSVTCAGGVPAPTCTGRPDGPTQTIPATKDPKVRQAIAAAIDPTVIGQRADDGKGSPSSDFFQKSFRWYPGIAGPKYDLENAKRLVNEAKAAGWDGKVRILQPNTPARIAAGLAAETMLKLAGIDAQLDTSKDQAGVIAQVTGPKDFDMAGWGFALGPDDGATWALAQNFLSTSSRNSVGYKNEAFDKAIKQLLVAGSDDEKKALFGQIGQAITNDVPFLPWALAEDFIAHGAKVHGIVQASDGAVLIDKAWIEA